MIGASIEPTHMITGLRLVDKMFAPRGVSADVLSKNSPPQPRHSMAIVTGQGEIARSPGLGRQRFHSFIPSRGAVRASRSSHTNRIPNPEVSYCTGSCAGTVVEDRSVVHE